jgi:hypothetical protein
MPKTSGPNIARIVYDSYPHSDLLPLDPAKDCRDLPTLMDRVRPDDIGDSLFRFLVVEIVEGGESTLDGAVRVVRRARDDVEAVLQGLVRARSGKDHDHEQVHRDGPGGNQRALRGGGRGHATGGNLRRPGQG